MALHCLSPFVFFKNTAGTGSCLRLLSAILAATPGRIFEKQNGSGNGHPLAHKIIVFMTLTTNFLQTADLLVFSRLILYKQQIYFCLLVLSL